MARRRTDRLGEQFKREITGLLQREVKDPRIGLATITGVEVTPDLSVARVFVSVIGDEVAKRQSLEGLRAAAPFLRTALGRRLRVRRVPELRFELDTSLEYARRIEDLLRRVRPEAEEEAAGPPPEGEGEGGRPAHGEDDG